MSLADRLSIPPAAGEAPAAEAPTADLTIHGVNSGAAAVATDQAKSSSAGELAPPAGHNSSDLGNAQVDGGVGSGLDEGDYEVEISLSTLQKNASADNPLYSMNRKFGDLIKDERLLRAITEMNFRDPSKVQASALPWLLNGDHPNMIAQSQSGTGKTATFVLTILSRIDHDQPEQPQALVLAPTRELARQIEGVTKAIGKYIPQLQVQVAVPGLVDRESRVKASVIVGTPGTVHDILRRGQVDASQLKILCVDEADNMMNSQGFADQCIRIKSYIPSVKTNSEPMQTLLFSATFPDNVLPFAKRFCPDSIELRLQRSEINVKGISQMFIDCPEGEGKYDVLVKLYGLMNIGSSIIFVKERRYADDLTRRMTNEGHSVACIHGAYDASERDRVVQSFRRGECKVLITTNVMARGIDVSSVSIVINYDIPMLQDGSPDMETYIHRIGRTGRFGRTGVSISFVNDHQSCRALKSITQAFNIHLVQLSTTNWDETEELVQHAIKDARTR